MPIPNKKITIGYTFLSAYIVKPVRVNGEVIGSSLTFVNHGNFGKLNLLQGEACLSLS